MTILIEILSLSTYLKKALPFFPDLVEGCWGVGPLFVGLGHNNWAFQSNYCFVWLTLVLAEFILKMM